MRILITAGPTREAIDPLRYLSNRSSGKMGYAIASAAIGRGHDAVLVSGPVSIPRPEGCEFISVECAAQMYDAVMSIAGDCEVAVMVAAVADYRPIEVSKQKIKKEEKNRILQLTRTKDVLGSMRKVFGFEGLLVGFAAETDRMSENALSKIRSKGCDLIVANDVSQSDIGFESDENEVTFFSSDGSQSHIGKCSKAEVAEAIMNEIESLVTG